MIVTTLSRKGPSGLLALPQSEGWVGGKEAFVSAHRGVDEASWLLQVPSVGTMGEVVQDVGEDYRDSISARRSGVIPRYRVAS